MYFLYIILYISRSNELYKWIGELEAILKMLKFFFLHNIAREIKSHGKEISYCLINYKKKICFLKISKLLIQIELIDKASGRIHLSTNR